MAEQQEKPPTLKTIAELTGLSISTVSLSLRDGSRLKQETRDKVAKAAAEIGYVPNRAGVRLRTGQTNVLTLILAPTRHAMDYARLLIEGIGTHIVDTKYHLNVIPELQDADPLSAVRYVMQNKTSDGIILTHTSARDPRVQVLMDAGFPFVSHGRTEFYSPHPFHDFDAETFVDQAVARLLKRGHRRFLLAAEDNGTMNVFNVVTAFRRAMAKEGLTAEIVTEPATLSTAAAARLFAEKLAEQSQTPDALIAINELTALSIIGGLAHKGRVLGRDFDLICKQTTEILPTMHPAMDTIQEDLFLTGQELAKLLIRRIEGEDMGALRSLQEPICHWRG